MGLRKISFFGLLLFFFVGCDIVEDAGKRSVIYVLIDNTRNCTESVIEDPEGRILGVIQPRSVRKIEVSAALFDQQDETILFAHTPHRIMDSILAGDTSVIPHGCDEWGMDTERIRLRDGYETEEFDVRLRPPRYWDEPDNWVKVPAETKVVIQSFWEAKGIDLNSEIPETKVDLK